MRPESVGLLITTCDRAELLRNSLERLSRLTLPDEIVLIDDGGSDETRDYFRAFMRATGIRGRYLYNDNPGQSICSFARNIGLKEMRSDIVITSEPELIFLTDVILAFALKMQHHPSDVISAGTVYHQGVLASLNNIVEHGDPKKLQVTDYKSGPPDWQGHYMRTRGWVAPYTAAYRRSWLMDIGGWDEGFPGNWGWDDIDLLTRLRINGHPQQIVEDIEVLHQWHDASTDQGAQGEANEEYFYGRSFHSEPGESDTADVVANKGVEWGTLKQ